MKNYFKIIKTKAPKLKHYFKIIKTKAKKWI